MEQGSDTDGAVSASTVTGGLTGAAGVKSLGKLSKALLAHERTLLESSLLSNVTHAKSTSVWLDAASTSEDDLQPEQTRVYRPMGDDEILYLIQNNFLPGQNLLVQPSPQQNALARKADRRFSLASDLCSHAAVPSNN